MGLKDLFLNKGWAGTTLSRPETAERLNPLLRSFRELNLTYDGVIKQTQQPAVREVLEKFQHDARVEVGKVSETILSCGGVPYNGVDIEPEHFVPDGDERQQLNALRRLETDFFDLVTTESKQTHQMRTRAILQVLLSSSKKRLDYLRGTLV